MRFIFRLLLGTSIGVLLCQSPVHAQFQTAPFNPGSSGTPSLGGGFLNTGPFVSGGNPLGGILSNGDPLGGLFGGSGSNPLGGIFGNQNPLGGLFGGSGSNPLGGLFGGGSGSANGGSDALLTNIQGLLGNLDRIAQDPLVFIGQITGGGGAGGETPISTLPKELATVEAVLKQNQSAMGLPDLAQAKLGVWRANTAVKPLSALDLFHLKQGQVTSRATQSQAQTVLGKDGQQLQKDGMKAVSTAIGGAKQVVPASGQVAQQTTQFAQQASQVAQTTGQLGQKSTQTASQVTSTAGKIKSAISTQDAIKGLGEQNAQLANILSGMSNQLGGSSNQLSSLSSELSGLSTQSAQTNTQLGEVAAINGDQAISLRNLQVSGAIANANLGEVSEMLHGHKRQQALNKEALTLMPAMNPMILFR